MFLGCREPCRDCVRDCLKKLDVLQHEICTRFVYYLNVFGITSPYKCVYNFVGFYHSAVMNTYYIQGEDMDFWELARKCSSTLEEAIKRRKHFTDMGDVGLLMCQAIQRPHLTPFSSLRTSTLVVFDNEEYVQNVQDQKKDEQLRDDFDELGLLEYVGCSSIHGVGPSIAIFDCFHQGALYLNCVFPYPLHSHSQMQELVSNIISILKLAVI